MYNKWKKLHQDTEKNGIWHVQEKGSKHKRHRKHNQINSATGLWERTCCYPCRLQTDKMGWTCNASQCHTIHTRNTRCKQIYLLRNLNYFHSLLSILCCKMYATLYDHNQLHEAQSSLKSWKLLRHSKKFISFMGVWRFITLFTRACSVQSKLCRQRLKCDGTRAETRFCLSVKSTSPFKSAGVLVQSTTGSRGVRISGSKAGYTKFWGSVKGTGYPLHSPVSPSLPLQCVTACHRISTRL